MKRRSPAAPLLLPLVTFGIYQLVWYVKTKNEMNQRGAGIPTAWLIIIPFVSIWWLWKHSVAVEQVTQNRLSRHAAFWLTFFFGVIGNAIVQNALNNALVSSAQQNKF